MQSISIDSDNFIRNQSPRQTELHSLTICVTKTRQQTEEYDSITLGGGGAVETPCQQSSICNSYSKYHPNPIIRPSIQSLTTCRKRRSLQHIDGLLQQCHYSKITIFQECNFKVCKCYKTLIIHKNGCNFDDFVARRTYTVSFDFYIFTLISLLFYTSFIPISINSTIE